MDKYGVVNWLLEENLLEAEKYTGKTINAEKVAEEIQSGFYWDENAEFPTKMKRDYWSDLLGSDWGSPGLNLKELTPIEAYATIRKYATKKYGKLPWGSIPLNTNGTKWSD
jgi:hypothetical protein